MKLLSHVRLSAIPQTVAYQAPPSTEFSRQEYWRGLPFPAPGDLPDLWIKPRSPALQADALLSELPGKPLFYIYTYICQKKIHLHLQLERSNRHAESKQYTFRERMKAGAEVSTGKWAVEVQPRKYTQHQMGGGSTTEKSFQSPGYRHDAPYRGLG